MTKYSPVVYAKALFDVLTSVLPLDRDGAIVNFWKTVGKNGDESRAGDIVQEFEELSVRENGGRVIILEMARKHGLYQNELGKLFHPNDLVRSVINQSLVAGVRVTIDGSMELDSSLAGKFRKIFR